MKHRIAGLASLPRACFHAQPQHLRRIYGLSQCNSVARRPLEFRSFSVAATPRAKAPKFASYQNSNARPAAELNENVSQEEKEHFARRLEEDRGKQIRTPWHREGNDVPPVARQRSAGAMTKGASYQLEGSQTGTDTR